MIGKKVRVFWPVDNSWYIGTVQQFNASTGEHLLKYEDDDTEWVQIGESNTTMNPSDFHPQRQPQHQSQPQHPHQAQLGVVPPQSSGFVTRRSPSHEAGSSSLLETPAANTKNTTTTATEKI